MDSGGGPLICATPSAREEWRGVNGSSVAGVATDYARACAELDYVGVIPCRSQEVLVLGDEPLQSTFARMGDDLIIARWVSCSSHERAAGVLASMPFRLPVISGVYQFLVEGPCLCIFDAAHDRHSMLASGSTISHVVPGRYEVTTESYKQDQEFEFLIHRLRRLSAA